MHHDTLQNTCSIDIGMRYSREKQHFRDFFFEEQENVQFGVHNEWRVVRHDVIDSVNFADRADAAITLGRIGRFCSKFSQFVFLIFLHSLTERES